jgi:hypothetical protein
MVKLPPLSLVRRRETCASCGGVASPEKYPIPRHQERGVTDRQNEKIVFFFFFFFFYK